MDEPAVTPVTTPVALTVATAAVPLVQVPPLVASAKVVFAPTHTVRPPVMVPALGAGFTVTG
jgi:hypothetical protein